MDATELTTKVTVGIGGLSTLFTADEYTSANDKAIMELGWSFPLTDTKKQYWAIERMKRHLIEILLLTTADQFRYKDLHRQQKFEHYEKVLKRLDDAFTTAQEEDPALFASVDSSLMFGTYASAGFVTDRLGRDRTYTEDDTVIILSGD